MIRDWFIQFLMLAAAFVFGMLVGVSLSQFPDAAEEEAEQSGKDARD